MNKNRIFPLLLTLCLVLSFFAGSSPLATHAQPQAAGPLIPQLLGQAGGASVALTYEPYSEGYGYLYQGVGPRLYIYWVDQVKVLGTPTLTLLGVSEPLPDIIQGVSMVWDTAYVTLGNSGLAVINTVKKDAPVITGVYDTPGFARGLWFSSDTINSYVYVADGETGVLVLKVTNPTAIVEVGRFDTDGNARDLHRATDDAYGPIMFVADGAHGLLILKFDYPATLTRLKAVDTSYAEDIFIHPNQTNYLHLADGSAGWKSIKISDLDKIAIEDVFNTPGYAYSVMYYNGEVYVADNTYGLRVIGTDPVTGNPIEIASLDTPGRAMGMGWAEGIVLMADYSALRAIDASSPSAPFEVTTASRESVAVPGRLTAVGSTVYIADPWQGLRILDASIPAAPTLTGTYDSPGTAYDVAVSGDLAYLADGTGGLRLLDISDLTNPVEINSFGQEGFTDFRAVAVDSEVAFVANGALGISAIIFDEDPFQTQQYIFPDLVDATDIALAGEYAYIADGTHGLVIIDRVPLGDMYQVGHVDTPGTASAVAVQGSYAYVADGASGLQIFNIADPTIPVLAGSIDTPGSAVDVAVKGFLAYVADSSGGFHVVNIANPAAPSLLFSYDTIGSATGVGLSDGGIFVADAEGGLLVFTPPPDFHAVMLPLVIR